MTARSGSTNSDTARTNSGHPSPTINQSDCLCSHSDCLRSHSCLRRLQVSKIHRQLPPGGVLVFLSGQREVQELVSRLRQTFPDTKKLSVAATSQPDARALKPAKGQTRGADGLSAAHKTSTQGIESSDNGQGSGARDDDEDNGLTGGLDAAESSDHPGQSSQVQSASPCAHGLHLQVQACSSRSGVPLDNPCENQSMWEFAPPYQRQ